MIVTFYSFKGGVGRSMALVNVAEILADRGYRVVACDWDLEAPGLERYFTNREDPSAPWQSTLERLTRTPGLIDLISEYRDALSRPVTEDLKGEQFALLGDVKVRRPSSVTVPVSERGEDAPHRPLRAGSVRLMTAGRRDGAYQQSYAEVVRSFNWDEFYTRWAGGSYIEFFRRDLVGDSQTPGAADILLLDSRTGVTEHGGICTHHLADLVLMMTAANDANVEGTEWMAAALTDPRLPALRMDRPVEVLPIAARIEQTSQKNELVQFQQRFVVKFGRYIAAANGIDLPAHEVEHRAEIPYMPYYSFEERVCAREPASERQPNLYEAYETVAELIVANGVSRGLLPRKTSGAHRLLARSRSTFVAAGLTVSISAPPRETPLAKVLAEGLTRYGFRVLDPGDKTRPARGIVLFGSDPSPRQQAEIADFLREQALRSDFRAVPLVPEGAPVPQGQHPIVVPPDPDDPFFAALAAELAAPDGARVRYTGSFRYVGAEAYPAGGVQPFFGRSSELESALQQWGGSQRWLHVKGPSGIGKTSFVWGGVIPAVRRGAVRGIPDDVEVLDAEVPVHPDRPLLLVAEDRDLSRIAPLIERPNVYLITTSRSGDPPVFTAREMRPSIITLGLLSRAAAREALEGPARVAGIVWERGLIDRVIHDLAAGPLLPDGNDFPAVDPLLLGVVASELGHRPTHEAYQNAGGVAGVVVRLAERALHDEAPRVRRLLTRILAGELLTLEDARKIVGGDDAATIVDRLSDCGLLRVGDLVELRHPLMAIAPTLTRWLEKERDTYAVIRAANAANEVWEKTGHRVLPSGRTLDFLRSIVAGSGLKPFLAGALREHARRRIQFIASLLFAMLLGFAAREGMRLWNERQDAIRAANNLAHASEGALRTDPVRALVLAIEAGRRAETAPSRAALVKAIRTSRLRLMVKHEAPVVAAALSEDGKTLMTGDWSEVHVRSAATGQSLRTSRSPAYMAALPILSPKTDSALWVDRDLAHWWDGSRTPWKTALRISVFDGPAFTPDGEEVVSVDADTGVVQLWDLRRSTSRVLGVVRDAWWPSVSSDGRITVVPSRSGGASVFSLEDMRRDALIARVAGDIGTLAFSSRSDRMITGGLREPTVRQWTFDPRGIPVSLPWMIRPQGGRDFVAVGYGNRDQMIAFLSAESSFHIWRAGTPTPGIVITVPFKIRTFALANQSPTVALAGDNGTVAVYRLTPAGDAVHSRYQLTGHTSGVRQIFFSADERQIVTAGDDRTTRIWSAEDPVIPDDFDVLLDRAEKTLPATLTRAERSRLIAGF